MTLLVLMPGMDGTGDLFAPLIQALGPSQPAAAARVIAEFMQRVERGDGRTDTAPDTAR